MDVYKEYRFLHWTCGGVVGFVDFIGFCNSDVIFKIIRKKGIPVFVFSINYVFFEELQDFGLSVGS